MAKATKRKKKTPPRWQSKANAERIFDAMANGSSLREICRNNGWAFVTVYDWLKRDYAEQYADAQAARADYYFDEIAEIADKACGNKAAVAKARLQIDTRKWIMGRMAPKKYGDRVNVDVGGKATVEHAGKIDVTPSDMAISGIAKILNAALGAGKDPSVEDTRKE